MLAGYPYFSQIEINQHPHGPAQLNVDVTYLARYNGMMNLATQCAYRLMMPLSTAVVSSAAASCVTPSESHSPDDRRESRL